MSRHTPKNNLIYTFGYSKDRMEAPYSACNEIVTKSIVNSQGETWTTPYILILWGEDIEDIEDHINGIKSLINANTANFVTFIFKHDVITKVKYHSSTKDGSFDKITMMHTHIGNGDLVNTMQNFCTKVWKRSEPAYRMSEMMDDKIEDFYGFMW